VEEIQEVQEIQAGFENASAENVLAWALKKFGTKLGLASSFGAEDVVLIDLAVKIDPAVRVFTLDTGRLHQETYEVMDAIRQRYGIAIEVCFPERNTVTAMVEEHGLNLFYRSIESRKLCCRLRKVEPLRLKLKEFEAWVCGLRQDQAVTRTGIKKVEFDATHGLVKINPLADWTAADIWDYIREHDVPYNKLHDKEFPSIGCAPCTRPVAAGEDIRAGRWWWEEPDKKECGLHTTYEAAKHIPAGKNF
jgi:phosphoadenosine phosphosulfate reductase